MQDRESFTFFPLTVTSWKIAQKGFHVQQIENITVDYYFDERDPIKDNLELYTESQSKGG
jgi:hypothetical protein